MNTQEKIREQNLHAEQFSENPLALITVLFHLMTCYAARPCGCIAKNVQYHMDLFLNSEASDLFDEWQPAFETLQSQWNIIIKQHAQNEYKKAIAEASKHTTH